MVIVDSNIIFDLWDQDPVWSPWSAQQLRSLSTAHDLAINAVVYAEISARFSSQAKLDKALDELGLIVLEIPLDAAFLAGKAATGQVSFLISSSALTPHRFAAKFSREIGGPIRPISPPCP